MMHHKQNKIPKRTSVIVSTVCYSVPVRALSPLQHKPPPLLVASSHSPRILTVSYNSMGRMTLLNVT